MLSSDGSKLTEKKKGIYIVICIVIYCKQHAACLLAVGISSPFAENSLCSQWAPLNLNSQYVFFHVTMVQLGLV